MHAGRSYGTPRRLDDSFTDEEEEEEEGGVRSAAAPSTSNASVRPPRPGSSVHRPLPDPASVAASGPMLGRRRGLSARIRAAVQPREYLAIERVAPEAGERPIKAARRTETRRSQESPRRTATTTAATSAAYSTYSWLNPTKPLPDLDTGADIIGKEEDPHTTPRKQGRGAIRGGSTGVARDRVEPVPVAASSPVRATAFSFESLMPSPPSYGRPTRRKSGSSRDRDRVEEQPLGVEGLRTNSGISSHHFDGLLPSATDAATTDNSTPMKQQGLKKRPKSAALHRTDGHNSTGDRRPSSAARTGVVRRSLRETTLQALAALDGDAADRDDEKMTTLTKKELFLIERETARKAKQTVDSLKSFGVKISAIV